MITLNGQALPAPSALSVRVTPQAGSARYNTLGQLVQDGMRDKRAVTLRWTRMESVTLEALAALLSAGGFLTLTYPDPLSGSRQMTCRAREQSARVWHWENGSARWADVTLTLEER